MTWTLTFLIQELVSHSSTDPNRDMLDWTLRSQLGNHELDGTENETWPSYLPRGPGAPL